MKIIKKEKLLHDLPNVLKILYLDLRHALCNDERNDLFNPVFIFHIGEEINW